MLSFASTNDFGSAFDCGRFGQPKEETLFHFICDSQSGLGAMMPPQVGDSQTGKCRFHMSFGQNLETLRYHGPALAGGFLVIHIQLEDVNAHRGGTFLALLRFLF